MQFAAILAASIMVVTSLVLCVRFGWHREQTVSRHVAQRRWSAAVFGVAMGVTGVVMAVYTWGWLRPRAGLPWWALVPLGAVCLGLVLIAVFPRRPPLVGIHHHASWATLVAMAVAAPALVAATWGHAGVGVRVFDVVFLGYTAVLVGVRFTRFLKPYYLYWETSFFLGFFVLWLTAT